MRPGARTGRVVGVSILLAVTLLPACASSTNTPPPDDVLGDDAVTVGSFDFAESHLLGELYAQALEGAGISVVREFDIGPRDIVMPALQRGLLEVVPEYEGSALEFLGGEPTSDGRQTRTALQQILSRLGLDLLEPSPAQDHNAFVVTDATASQLDLRTLSDLRGVSESLDFGGPPECPERPLCLGGLEDRYGLTFASFVPLDAGGPLTVQALDAGLVDVGLLFSTDGRLAGPGFVELRDDRSLQPAERIAPIVKREVVERFGTPAVQALDGVSRALTTDELRAMNAQVANGASESDVAAAWIDAHPPDRSG